MTRARDSRRTRVTTTIDLSGPLFAKDPAKTFRQNVRDLMDAVVEQGERDVVAQLRAGEAARRPMRGISPDRVSGHVRGRTSNLAGRRWAVSGVVSVNNRGFSPKQGITLMAAAARLEQKTHAFRKTTARLRRARGVNLDELLKGLD